MQKMESINLDKWRQLNETLFKSYIECYRLLAIGEITDPSKAMIDGLTKYNILKKVTDKDYSSFYTIARELGIFFQNPDNSYSLSPLAQQYLESKLSYRDYLKYYILNTEFLISNNVVHPFEEIAKNLNKQNLSIDELSEKCIKCIPVNKRSSVSTDHLNVFLKRAIEAGLINKIDEKYSLNKDYQLIENSINKSGLDNSAFEDKFIGSLKDKQKNVSIEMINKAINPKVLDDPKSKTKSVSFPLNQILFGPPGTGKTDATIELSLKILGKASAIDNLKLRREENRETFQSLLSKRIFFVTMHPSFSYEDFVQGIKPRVNSKEDLIFSSHDGVFKRVSDLAKEVFLNEGEEKTNIIDNRDILRVAFFISKFNYKDDKKANKALGVETYNQLFEKLEIDLKEKASSFKNHRDKFDYLCSDERSGWVPKNGSADKLDNTASWPYQDIYEELNSKSFDEVYNYVQEIIAKAKTPHSKLTENANFVIILDEINRANISKVFGELITLLEGDKRIGGENFISVQLPSGDEFSVPPNLYVIGTMNTADKSLSLVDIALRRRFQFTPIYPDDSIIRNFGESSDRDTKADFMVKINSIIRKEKSVDFQIGHAYFLKSNSLNDVVNENVIPLLTEYFRNDLEKVKLILKDVGIVVDEIYFSETGLLRY